MQSSVNIPRAASKVKLFIFASRFSPQFFPAVALLKSFPRTN
jgi:hypothetical protein